MSKVVDLMGRKFGRLTVISKSEKKSKFRRIIWLCKCECGKVVEVFSNSLLTGNTKSCGCYSKELASNRLKIEYGLSSAKRAFNSYRHHAKVRKVTFEISFKDFLEISKKNCYFCGQEPSNLRKSRSNNGDFKYSGIDRLNNLEGYTLKNSVSCCFWCNKMKSDYSLEEFLEQIKKIHSLRLKG